MWLQKNKQTKSKKPVSVTFSIVQNKYWCSRLYFEQEDDKTSNIDPAAALTVVEENSTPMSASVRRQTLYVPHNDTEESDNSDESPMPVDSLTHESRNKLNRFL